MTKRMIESCSVARCGKLVYCRDLCRRHYRDALKSSDERVQTPNGEALAYLFDSVLPHTSKSACLIWPYSRGKNGYALIFYKGKTRIVTRLVCRKIKGKAPTKSHYACHSCGKGHEGCVNPHHLYWGTNSQNQKDRVKHGTDHKGEQISVSKLTESKVRKIVRLIARGRPFEDIAERFGVTSRSIYHIHAGDTWQHVTSRDPVYSTLRG